MTTHKLTFKPAAWDERGKGWNLDLSVFPPCDALKRTHTTSDLGCMINFGVWQAPRTSVASARLSITSDASTEETKEGVTDRERERDRKH